MSEYKSLKEWFGKATRGDGRKFSLNHWNSHTYFEPIFLTRGVWHGVDEAGCSLEWQEESISPFREWHPPKKTKKITLYKPVFETIRNKFYCPQDAQWHSDKDYYKSNFHDIKGWMRQEVEVDDE